MLRFASNRVTGGSLGFCGFLRGFLGFSRLPTTLLAFFNSQPSILYKDTLGGDTRRMCDTSGWSWRWPSVVSRATRSAESRGGARRAATLESWSDSKIRLRTLRALTALLFEARKEKSCDLSPARSQPAPLEARQPRSKPWRRRLPPLPGRAERRRRAAQATTSAPPTGGAAAAAPTAPPSAAARGCRRDAGR